MKKTLFPFSFLLIISFCISAQKEVYFNTAKQEDIKVVSMQGIEIGSNFDPSTIINDIKYNRQSFHIPINIGYFNEKRIAPTLTLISSAEIAYGYSKSAYSALNDTMYNGNISYIYKTSYSLGLNLSVEPRWYFSYKNRYTMGRAMLNSGWFLSLPVSYGITLLSNSEYFNKPTWLYDKYYGSLSFSPAFGYRQAITKHLFLEGNIKYLNGDFSFYEKNKMFFITGPLFFFSPTLSIKAAYTFK
ncbi:MAG: hypothetical protein ACYC25_00495 [Paludibacter sp.]